MNRGFEAVLRPFKKYDRNAEVMLPVRADRRSAGYDFFSPIDVIIPPKEKVTIWTNVKAYMMADEVLELYVRSSIGIKKALMLANIVGIIDSSYYGNPTNDGNIGIVLYNYGESLETIEAGERIGQGVFQKYLVADEDICLMAERLGGTGSSGR